MRCKNSFLSRRNIRENNSMSSLALKSQVAYSNRFTQWSLVSSMEIGMNLLDSGRVGGEGERKRKKKERERFSQVSSIEGFEDILYP